MYFMYKVHLFIYRLSQLDTLFSLFSVFYSALWILNKFVYVFYIDSFVSQFIWIN